VILVIRQTLINLGASDVRETAGDNAVHSFTVLKEADDVVDADASALNDGVAAAHALPAGDVAISDSCSVSVHNFNNTSSGFIMRDYDVGDLGLHPMPAVGLHLDGEGFRLRPRASARQVRLRPKGCGGLGNGQNTGKHGGIVAASRLKGNAVLMRVEEAASDGVFFQDRRIGLMAVKK